MAAQQADDGIQEQSGGRKAMKRRGILVAAGAVVAGIVAKQANQPVAATSGTGGDGPLVLGSNSADNTANYASVRTELVSGLTFHGPVLLDCSASPFQSSGDTNAIGVSGTSRGTAAGVYGTDVAGGKSSGYPGGMNAGIYGYTYAQGHSGVRGDGGTNGIGVSGVSTNSNAILGTTLGSAYNQNAAVLGLGNAIGVEGNVPAGSTIANTIAVKGTNNAVGAGGIGVQGVVNAGSAGGTIAISGTNNATAANSHGIVGTAGSGHGLIGNTNFTGGGPPYYGGLVGNAPNGAYAGLFFGSVSITGTLNGHTAIMQQAQIAVAHPDGGYRLSYALSSTENWIEDAGKGTLVSGQATVKIDPAFAALADLSDYHVFLTAYGDYHLHVPEMKAEEFSVRVSSAGSGTLPTGGAPVPGSQVAKASNVVGTFSWKVMAKRKDGQAARLATYTFPKLEPPRISDPPKGAQPQTKP